MEEVERGTEGAVVDRPLAVKGHAHAREQPHFGELAAAVVAEQKVAGRGVVGHEDVGIAIAVIVGADGAHSRAGAGANARLLGHFAEPAIAPIAEQLVGLVGIGAGAGVAGNAPHHGHHVVLEAENHVVRHEQVKQAVGIEIQEVRPCPELVAAGRAGGRGNVGKSAIAPIAVHAVGAEVVHIDIRQAIAVVIPHAHAHAVTGIAHAGLVGHVGEPEVPQVAVQGVSGVRVGRAAGQRPAAEKIDVH